MHSFGAGLIRPDLSAFDHQRRTGIYDRGIELETCC
jgi:hypothetical protein